ncbi:adenylate/guanylate cyclase domain-containing protein [bacterium]|nr:adenylate/guanylate cyclase domain-containing protein [bacterium]
MMELIVTGPEAAQEWRRELPDGEVIRLGRAPRSGWAVPWDLLISREHCELSLTGTKLSVKRLDAARNPVYFQEVDTKDFVIGAGQGFRIGQTMFQLVSVELSDGQSGSHIEEHSFGPDQLRQFKFHDAEHRLEVLTRLPEAISRSRSDSELAIEAVKVLLRAMPHARAAACVQLVPGALLEEPPIMMRWDSRDEDIGRFSPSRRLLASSIERGEGVLHIWQDTDESNPAFTVTGNLDWAFCMPLKGEACYGWALYVTGQFGGPGMTSVGENDLKGDLRFTELVSDFVSSIRQVKSLQQQQAGLAQFFSPAVIEAIRESNSDAVLAPKEADITVLFCDVRGFSRKSEEARDNLRELLDRVSHALGVMTAGILKYDGVIADFQGDAALGFWGWPKEPDEGPIAACRAALHIQQQFQKATDNPSSPLYGFNVGIGVAHGRAIAGKIGTQEQIKVGAFGPVVNQGARLESMTKHVRAPILIDEVTAEHVRNLPDDDLRCRKLGRIRPYGMNDEIAVFELLPPDEPSAKLTKNDIGKFEAAVDAVTDGRWQEALEMLNELPVDDRTKDFLMIFIAMNHYEPPKDWDGVIQMMQK